MKKGRAGCPAAIKMSGFVRLIFDEARFQEQAGLDAVFAI
jgi:hypothetical protein